VDQLKESPETAEKQLDGLVRVWSNLLVALLKKRRNLLDDKCILELTNSYLDCFLHLLAEAEESVQATLTAQVLLQFLNAASRCVHKYLNRVNFINFNTSSAAVKIWEKNLPKK